MATRPPPPSRHAPTITQALQDALEALLKVPKGDKAARSAAVATAAAAGMAHPDGPFCARWFLERVEDAHPGDSILRGRVIDAICGMRAHPGYGDSDDRMKAERVSRYNAVSAWAEKQREEDRQSD